MAAAADATQWPNALAVLDAMGRSRGEVGGTVKMAGFEGEDG